MRWFLCTLFILSTLAPAFGQKEAKTDQKQKGEGSKPDISKLDPAMDVNKNASGDIDWYDVTDWGVEGRILPSEERKSWFDRFPASAEGLVTGSVWSLSRDSAGMVARFKTNARSIHVHYKTTKDKLAMPHMPATGVSGVDLYARDDQGHWKWVQVTKPANQEVKAEIIKGLAEGEREYAAYLPLYNGVQFMKMGFRRGVASKGFPRVKSRSSFMEPALRMARALVGLASCIQASLAANSTCQWSTWDSQEMARWMPPSVTF